MTVASDVENALTESLRQTAAGEFPIIAGEVLTRIRTKLDKLLKKIETLGLKAVILVSPRNRLPLRRVLARDYPDLMIVSYSEIVGDLPVEGIGILNLSEDNDENKTV